MGLSAGMKLGPYEILEQLGAGGMGEVYKGRDTRLDRIVAIKILSGQASAMADLKARFEREARSISALNHPNICQLHDIGNQDGTDFLVMEFIDGETMATRLQRGPMPIGELLRVGSDIADALDRAHRAGIVHRDLKPGNVMLTKSGAKLLDFGLAKPSAMAAASSVSAPLLSAAVTMTGASPLTAQGVVVGTVQYMAPEQIEGKNADARSDIFSLGALLYEGATGKRAFEGKSQISVASAILEKDPDPISTLQPAAPTALDFVVQTCLAKNPDDRYQTAHDVKLQLKWIGQSSSTVNKVLKPAASRMRRNTIAALAIVGIAIALVAAWALLRSPFGQRNVVHTSIVLPDKVEFDIVGDFAGAPALSPDGSMLVFGAHLAGNQPSLWLRRMDASAPTRIDGTEGAAWPFWSPDGKYIAFFSGGMLKKVPVEGGPPMPICPAPNPRGGTWAAGDTILLVPQFQGEIYRVSANGGTPVAVTNIDLAHHTTHRWPFALPDGKHFLFFATNHDGTQRPENGLYFASLDGKTVRQVLSSDGNAVFANGYLLFHTHSALVAQPFDPSSGTLSGSPVTVADQALYDVGTWHTVFTASQNGLLVYEGSSGSTGQTQLGWYDRTGKDLGRIGPPGSYLHPKLSPDGSRIAVVNGSAVFELWVMDAQRGTHTRLTFGTNSAGEPSWSPDGKLIAFTSSGAQRLVIGGGVRTNIKARPANGSGAEETLVDPTAGQFTAELPQWSPDGKYLTYLVTAGPTGHSIYAKPTDGSAPPKIIAAPASSQANISFYAISPDGKWLAYSSDESGEFQIYVAPFMRSGGKWQISSATADFPAWRRDGKELFYLGNADATIYAAAVSGNGDEFTVNDVKPLFKMATAAAAGVLYDVTADGQKFLINVTSQHASTPLDVVQNWTASIKK